MKKQTLLVRLSVLASGAAVVGGVAASPLSESPVAVAIRHGDCHGAVQLVLQGAQAKDALTIFLGGRMLDDGQCVKQDSEAAGKFFARASDLGERDSSLEYAAKIGMGEGFDQSYQRAGEVCRGGGTDPEKRLSDYSLGYVCTLRGIAGRFLRERLPAGAFRPGSGELLLEFNPASRQMSIRSTPQVMIDRDAATGSHIRRVRVNAQAVVEDAWSSALEVAPKPEPARLDNQPAQLSLDVDMALDSRRVSDATDPDHKLKPYSPEMLTPEYLLPKHMGPAGQ